jgi:predicted membrane protein
MILNTFIFMLLFFQNYFKINFFTVIGWFITTFILAIGLYFNYKQLKENNKTREINLFYNHLSDIKKMEFEEFKISLSNKSYNKKEWHRQFLNSVE